MKKIYKPLIALTVVLCVWLAAWLIYPTVEKEPPSAASISRAVELASEHALLAAPPESPDALEVKPVKDLYVPVSSPSYDALSDHRLTEEALAQDDDHYSLPITMRQPDHPYADTVRAHVSLFLEQADTEEGNLRKQISHATDQEASPQEVDHLQRQLDQLRKLRQDIILQNLYLLDEGFFHDSH